MTQEFIEAFDKWSEYLNQLGYRKVVTCKDCKYSVDEYGDGECYCDYEKDLRYIKDWDHYCSWAKR